MSRSKLHIWLVESFYQGSHKNWAESYQQHSQHKISIFKLPGRHWKFRMQASAIPLAQQMNSQNELPDYILVSDMVNLPELRGFLKPALQSIPMGLYMHENQITYPWSSQDSDVKHNRDHTYGMINIKSYLAADQVFFNSHYHMQSFHRAGQDFLSIFPDRTLLKSFRAQHTKAAVLPVGVDMSAFRQKKVRANICPVILWNHRWEYDKCPEEFFRLLDLLKSEKQAFKLIVCGAQQAQYPEIFDSAQTKFEKEIIHWGYAESKSHYYELIEQSDIALVTANQDFFGISVAEAIAGGCIPILPYRLAYPEHIPEPFQKDYMYKNETEAFQLLKRYTSSIHHLPKGIDNHIQRYDWRQVVTFYDQTFMNASKKAL